MQRVLVLATALLLFSFASTSHAYSWMIRTGIDKCANCHTDPMGGETLTSFGRVMSETTLSTKWSDKGPSSASELFFGIPEPKELRIGGSFRYMDALYSLPYHGTKSTFDDFPMQLDAYGQLTLFDHLKIGGSIGVSRTTNGRTEGLAAQVTKGNNPDDWNMLSRSHWIGYQVNDAILIRAGRLNLPFGIRMPEHTMWVRADTRTDRESSQQDGLAFDYSAGRIRGEVMGIAGNYLINPDKWRDRGYSLYGEYMLTPTAAVGISSLVTHADHDIQDKLNETRQAHGLTGRYSPLRPLVLLAEADLLISDQRNPGYTAMLQVDYEIIQGLHGMLTGETHEPGRLSNTPAGVANGENQLGGWITLDWFFFTHFDARIDFVLRQNTAPQLLSQIHWYF
ncbi:MAG TPA: hypothetical protein VHC69_34420 [Polyangiaceae bacterium]|nr:hypothetical protein [Polyangiaceae bacterium]